MANINQNLTEDPQGQGGPVQNGFPHVMPQTPLNDARGGGGKPAAKPVAKPGGAIGARPGAGKPAGQKPKAGQATENTNAGHMLPDAEEFDAKADVDKYAAHRDVTPEVAGGGVQMVGGIVMPEDSGEDDEPDDDDQTDAVATKQPKAAKKK